jgi:NitT/TauT family transport system ATP-binding protein
MAQRAAFARCLARRPSLLLLDEPFAALDEHTRGDLQSLLLELARRDGTSIILSTHDLDEALQLSDRVLLLGGRPARIVHSWHVPRDTESRDGQLRLSLARALAASTPRLRSGKESPYVQRMQ